MEDQGVDLGTWLRMHIDFEAVAYDLRHDYTTIDTHTLVHIYRDH